MTQDEKNSKQGEIAQSGMVFKSIRQRPRPFRLVLIQQTSRLNNVGRPTVSALNCPRDLQHAFAVSPI